MIAIRLRSVRDKLLLMVLVANFFTLVVAGAALFYHDLQENRNKAVSELTALANILGQGSVVALEFDDAKVATENLAQLRANPSIVAAAIYTAKGNLFAQHIYNQNDRIDFPRSPEADGFHFDVEELTVFKHIISNNIDMGAIYLKQRYEFSAWLEDYLMILGMVLAVSLGLGLLISSRLQRWISVPIEEVSSIARQVMEQRNYHLRAIKSTEDEVGQLADAFNGMLQTLEHEIAERNSAEQSIRTLNAELEERVTDRTHELQITNKALESRTQEAEAANRAKADFLANMSHEIRTPMNGILGLAYLLEQNNLDGDSADLVKKIRNSGRSLQAIINDILDFSKIEAGRLELEHTPFRLIDVLDNLSGIMAANAGDKDLELVISPAPDVGQLMGDALRLEQVLINLAGNAIKFTDHGSVALNITLLSRENNIATLRFAVKDSGIGIAAEKQAHIFSAFSQADISTTRRFGGTGLGLTICRHLVMQMGGEIGVISKLNQGSEFWFTIPFDCCAESDYAAPHMATLEVLIVDDSEIARENLCLTAQSVGWHPTQAVSGEAAIQTMIDKAAGNGKNAFNVLLVDWKMPGMDGLQVASKIHDTFSQNTAPIVLMVTAFSREELLKQNNIDMIDGVLTKPVTSSTLYNSVAEVLRQRETKSFAAGLRSSANRKQKRIPGVRVLLVDDSEINREVAKRILTIDGASVVLAEDGQAALDWLKGNPTAVDIVLMDVQMPIMDGYEATRQLRALPALAHLPVIALSAGAFKTQQEAAQNAGMNAFVAKPFNVDELVATIQALTHCEPELAIDEGELSSDGLAKIAQKNGIFKNNLYTENNGSAEAVPDDLPGIAVAKGLSVWNDMAIYRKFLQKFAKDYAETGREIAAHFTAKNYAAANALAHKLKGTAGNLALPELAKIAGELEVTDVTDYPTDALARLQTALDTVIASILLFVADSSSSTAVAPAIADRARAAELLPELMTALDTDTPDYAYKLLDDLIPVLPSISVLSLRNAVDNFDFRGAELLVRRLAEQLEIHVEE